MPAEWIWRNGEFVRWEDATVHVSAHALHYGSSVFEGIRAYATPDGPAVFRLQPHVKRLVNGVKVMRIDLGYDESAISQAILETIDRNGHEACYIRPVVFRGAGALGLEGRVNTKPECVVFTMEWGAYLGSEALENGVDVQVSSWRRMAPDTHAAMVKAGGNYVNSQFISMEAHDNGFSEGIALDVNGYVSEGAGENVFVVMDGVVYTPGSWSSILLGITRDSVLHILNDLGYKIEFQPIAREMLYMADEMFFTGTAAEITPIRSVDRLQVGAGKRGPITKQVQDEFFALTSGKKPDRHNWLTHVRSAVHTK
ncbi:branched-chain amino acid transaminase [Phototrophicus methaneseepsis]|uniref:Branched-chain-amino-acid aminotransferase n=1 Tax=Phototrophicus methaneseepsis TaxID=2710758 RepID=A0A7S8ICY5_9CHLR|nr:branched-chain amino acid transaminase [Phototrophicus methaneseepsis]QPC80997.1 branched-chain amino acid transaminase [Phototrophicus methaneseepsis]